MSDFPINLPTQLLRGLLRLCCCFSLASSHAEVVPVGMLENGTVSSSDITLTFLWKGDQSKATLILIPGGEGHLGLAPDRADLGGFYGKTLKPLSNSSLTSGLFNVVIFDSPVSLNSGGAYPISRASNDHLARIESVVHFYREKFKLPVWLMGHSNGAVSITELYKTLKRKHKEELVSGMIYSSGRNGARFDSDTNLPILFLAHEKDGCQKSTNANSLEVFKELGKYNKQKMEYVLLKSGEAEPLEPCRSGYHMFFNGHEEAYEAIDRFAAEILK